MIIPELRCLWSPRRDDAIPYAGARTRPRAATLCQTSIRHPGRVPHKACHGNCSVHESNQFSSTECAQWCAQKLLTSAISYEVRTPLQLRASNWRKFPTSGEESGARLEALNQLVEQLTTLARRMALNSSRPNS
jgi:hypothetical protein